MSTKKIIQDYTPEEIVESFVLPVELTAKQQEVAALQLSEHRANRKATMADDEKLQVKLLQLKYRLENYIYRESYDPKYTFGYFLEKYLDLINIKKKEFANDIQIHSTQLSNIIKNRREPNESLYIRLELHSNNTIPAIDWFKLTEKTKEFMINTNAALRTRESKYVTRKLAVKMVEI